MALDLTDRRTLVKSWLATLHSDRLAVRPQLAGPLPGWGTLVRTALGWHTVYALVSYAAAVAVSRGSGSGRIARAVADNGTTGIVIMTVAVWAGGVVLSSALWWAGIRRARRQR